MSVCEIIKQRIVENGIKQNFVAERVGMSPDLFQKSINGKRKLKADEFVAICRVMSLSIDDFSNVQ